MKQDRPKSRPPAKPAPLKRAPQGQGALEREGNKRAGDKRRGDERRGDERPQERPPSKRPPLKRAFEARTSDREQFRSGQKRPMKRAEGRPVDDGPPTKRPAFKRSPTTLERSPIKRSFAPPAPKKRPVPISAPPESKGPKSLLKTLDRVLSKAGLGSRTEARSWIGGGRVRVNGLLVQTPDYWVNPKTDKVTLDDNPIDVVERRYVLLNKPKGYITTYKDPEGRPTVYDLLKGVDQFLGTVGRLDMDTSGLLLLTNDNDLAEAVTNPAYKLEKTYLVKAATLLTEEQLDQLRTGVQLDDGPTHPAEVTVVREVGKHTFLEITITEGRNRQVRRMLEAVNSKVLKLVRVRLGPLTLEGLAMGSWRDLTEPEIARLASGKVRPKSKAAVPPED